MAPTPPLLPVVVAAAGIHGVAPQVGLRGSHHAGLFLLMTVLTQSFFALVRSHLVAFTFFSAWHSCLFYWFTFEILSATVTASIGKWRFGLLLKSVEFFHKQTRCLEGRHTA